MIRVTVKMGGDILRELQNMGAQAKPRVKKILQTHLVDRVVARAREIAPDDPEGETPDLRLSIRGVVRMAKGGIRASVIAGGSELQTKLAAEHRKNPGAHTVYAPIQHDDPTLHHARGQSNFVGQPFTERLPGLTEEFDKELISARS